MVEVSVLARLSDMRVSDGLRQSEMQLDTPLPASAAFLAFHASSLSRFRRSFSSSAVSVDFALPLTVGDAPFMRLFEVAVAASFLELLACGLLGDIAFDPLV